MNTPENMESIKEPIIETNSCAVAEVERNRSKEAISNATKKRLQKQKFVFLMFALLATLCITPILGVIAFLITKGITAISWDFLTTMPSEGMSAGGISSPLWGTFLLVFYTLLVSIPIGVFGAIYLSEYAPKNLFTRIIRLAIVNLAGVPSIVFGLFGLGFFVMPIKFPAVSVSNTITLISFIVFLAALGGFIWRYVITIKENSKFGKHPLDIILTLALVSAGLFFFVFKFPGQQITPGFQASIIAGSLTLAILVLPLIITSTEEALKTVPKSFREASLSLGATKWITVRKIILPNAIPGILTGIVLATGRAAGETAAILLTVAVFYQRFMPSMWDLYKPTMVLPYHLYILSTQAPNAPELMQWGTALVLLAVVLLFNITAFIIRANYRKKQSW